MWAVELYDRVEERPEKIFYFQHKENAEKKVEELIEKITPQNIPPSKFSSRVRTEEKIFSHLTEKEI